MPKSEIPNPFPIQPQGGRVFVIRDEAESQTEGGIVLAEAAKRDKQTGVIVAADPQIEPSPVGKHVLFSSYGGQIAQFGDLEFLVLSYGDDIMGVVV